jgi:hypothetical protein
VRKLRNLLYELRQQLPERGWHLDQVRIEDGRLASCCLESTIQPKGFQVNLDFSLGEGNTVVHLRLSSNRRLRYGLQETESVSTYIDGTTLGQQGVAIILAASRQLRRSASPPGDSEAPPAKSDPTVWQTSSDPRVVLQHLPSCSSRKLRLMACALMRFVPGVCQDARNEEAIRTAERYADGEVPKRDLKKARKAAHLLWLKSYEPREEALAAVCLASNRLPVERHPAICTLMRDLLPPPEQAAVIKPSWLRANGGLVVQVARGILEAGRFEELPILADALEEAGCAHAGLLQHCRGGGLHARGCWVLDAVLGRE